MRLPDRLQVPSGMTLALRDIQLLNEASASGSIVYSAKQITLASGIKSNVYVFFRGEATDNPTLLNMAGQKIARTVVENTLPDDHQQNLIGLPTAGTALAIAASMASVEIHRQDT